MEVKLVVQGRGKRGWREGLKLVIRWGFFFLINPRGGMCKRKGDTTVGINGRWKLLATNSRMGGAAAA